MFCSKCGFDNKDDARFCKKCGNQLNNQSINQNITELNKNQNLEEKGNNKLLIVCISIILIVLIIAGTLFLLSNENGQKSLFNNNQSNNISENNHTELKVNTATFYLDGNPDTGVTATINVGKEFTNENIEVMTTYYRDGVNINSPSYYENHKVDDEGNFIITDYTPMPKYPDKCLIELKYNNQTFKFECDMGKYKGSQTSVPRVV